MTRHSCIKFRPVSNHKIHLQWQNSFLFEPSSAVVTYYDFLHVGVCLKHSTSRAVKLWPRNCRCQNAVLFDRPGRKQKFTARVYCPGQWPACRKNLTDLSRTKLFGNSVCKILLRPSCSALGPTSILQTSFPNKFVGPVSNI